MNSYRHRETVKQIGTEVGICYYWLYSISYILLRYKYRTVVLRYLMTHASRFYYSRVYLNDAFDV